MSELKPCPFCGGEAEAVHEIDGFWTVECVKCGALVDGIEAWNTRAERTCYIEYPYYGDAPVINGQPRCSECKTEFAVGAFPNYCPNCGAKVVGE